MPQLVLQSIFLIRTFGTELEDDQATYFIFTSIAASVLSIVMKFRIADAEWLPDHASSAHFSHKTFPCISPSYLMSILWRICETITRFSIFTLLWAAVGGIWLVLYLLIALIGYAFLVRFTPLITVSPDGKQWTEQNRLQNQHFWLFVYVLQFLVGIPLRPNVWMFGIRYVENLSMLTIIYIFAFMEVDCSVCADQSASSNPYIRWTFFVSLGAAAVQLLLHAVSTACHLCGVEVISGNRVMEQCEWVGKDEWTEGGQRAATMHPKLLVNVTKKDDSANEPPLVVEVESSKTAGESRVDGVEP